MPRYYLKKIYQKYFAFTLAEVLIVLGIIGLIADMTIPTLVGKYQNQIKIIKLQKIYSSVEQVVQLSIIDNGEVSAWDFGSGMGEEPLKAFVEKYIFPYLRTIKSSNITNEVGSIETVLSDGSSLTYRFDGSAGYTATMYFIYDINGIKPPNKYGADKFVLALRRDTPNVSFFLWCEGGIKTRQCIMNQSLHGCNKTASGMNCGALIQYDGWKILEDYPR